MEKAKGDDAVLSAHISSDYIIAPNVDASRINLDKKFINYPEVVKGRTGVIKYRLENAGLKRKVGKN